ncbi:hypothetical protein AKJ38_02910 [candidate division MSBL1 archaeon SCGC-AAA259I14]|uniref:Transcription regulator TrmB N-terminal domain-containing protein n=1 Tax=candidate division MSBL1 archaeon SCGC-AAA259I14 TaxID=1698268 RepID=A0A133UR11_9EURY|nr:hypothetical protein AKJ38_02910 [candidate division MSBL1 archaeon SCGC-AAA259I14]
MDLTTSQDKLIVAAVAVFLCLSIATTAYAGSGDNVEVEQYIKAEGRLQSLENKTTTWMYGTHILVRDHGTQFALKSDTLDLDSYLNENVFVTGKVIHKGVDGGPTYLSVVKIGSSLENEENREDLRPIGSVYHDFYLARTNSISVGVALNKSGLSYDLKPFENMRNVEQLSSAAYLYRSHAMENLAVTVYEGNIMLKENHFLSVRLTPAYERVSKVAGYSSETNIQKAPSIENLRSFGWDVAPADDVFKVMYENKMFYLSLAGKRKGEARLYVNFAADFSEEVKTKVFDFIARSVNIDESEVREKLIPLNEETRTKIKPVIDFTDKKAGEALKTELKWLESNRIISGLSEQDLGAIGQVAKVGCAGVNSRIFYAKWDYPSPDEDFDVRPRENPRWMPYADTDYPLVSGRSGGLKEFQKEEVSIPDEAPQPSLQALIKDLRSELSQTEDRLETLKTELSEARETAENTVPIWMYGASMSVTIVAALGAVYFFKRKGSRGDDLPLSSFLLEQGLEDMTIKDAEIFRKILSEKRFTVPEIAEGAPVSRNSVRRLVNKLEENELVEQAGEEKSPGGRGKPRKVYRLAENIESRGERAV